MRHHYSLSLSLLFLTLTALPSLLAEDISAIWRDRNDWVIATTVVRLHQQGTLADHDIRALSWQRSAQAIRHALTWEERLQYNVVAEALGVNPVVEAKAMELLASARSDADAAAFNAAWEAGAAFNDDDHEAWGRALLAAGRDQDARDRLLLFAHPQRQTRQLETVLRDLPAPTPRPRVVLHSLLGGSGDQTITDISFSADGRAHFHGQGFTATVFLDTLQMHVEGDINTPGQAASGGGGFLPRGWKKGESQIQTVVDPNREQTYRWHTWQAHKILQQPYVASSAGWELWGWSYSEANPRELMADSRLYGIWLRPDGLLGGVGWTDGGNTVFARHPQDLGKGGMRGFGKGARMVFFTLDPDAEGAVVNYQVRGGVVPLNYPDPWGRLWMSGPFNRRAGFVGVDEELRPISGGYLGAADQSGVSARISHMVQAGRWLLLGGSSNAPRIRGVKAAQDRSGGDHDALIGIIQLW